MTLPCRYRLSLVLFLGFLLTSPTRASSEAKSCAATAKAWNSGKDKISLGKDSQFLYNFVNCLNGAKEAFSQIQGIIKQLPKVIDNVLSVSRTEVYALLSVYFLYQSFLLYDEAKDLEVDVKFYRNDFKLLEIEMKTVRDFIDTELIPQWKAGDTTNLEKNADKLLEKIGCSNAVLQELTQAIRQDIKKHGRYQRWSSFLAVGSAGGLVVCVGSLVVRLTPNVATPPSGVLGDASSIGLALPICAVAAIGIAGYSWLSYSTLSDNLPKLERLEKAATTMGQEITRYQSKTDLAKMRGEL